MNNNNKNNISYNIYYIYQDSCGSRSNPWIAKSEPNHDFSKSDAPTLSGAESYIKRKMPSFTSRIPAVRATGRIGTKVLVPPSPLDSSLGSGRTKYV
jgi:hypothetical protein